MALQQLTFDQMVNKLVTAYNAQAAANNSPAANTGPGSALGAIFNAISLLSLDMQLQILYVNNIARLQTSTGADIDTFVQPFGVTREAAVSATNSVIFTLNSVSASQTVIANGTYVQTVTGIQFQVVADTSQSGYSSANNGYLIPPGQTTVQATVQAVIAGSSGNVQAGTITQIVSEPGYPAPSGVSVTNNVAFTNGSDEETDSALITRFQQFMSNRFATVGAVANATATAENGLTYQVLDMMDQYGNAKPNFFTVVVNILGQNSGPTNTVLTTVKNAVTASRPVGMPFLVTGPTLVTVNVSATLTLTAGASSSSVQSSATTSVTNYINNIGLNINGTSTNCSYAQIVSLLLAVPGVANVTNVLLNSDTKDVTAAVGHQLVSGTTTWTTQ